MRCSIGPSAAPYFSSSSPVAFWQGSLGKEPAKSAFGQIWQTRTFTKLNVRISGCPFHVHPKLASAVDRLFRALPKIPVALSHFLSGVNNSFSLVVPGFFKLLSA